MLSCETVYLEIMHTILVFRNVNIVKGIYPNMVIRIDY